MSEKGHGRIRMDAELWFHLDSPVTPLQWHKAIFLPDTFEVERVEERKGKDTSRHYYHLFELDVVSVTIPSCDTEVDVTPIYRVDGDVVSLDHIQMTTWDGEHWRTIEPVGESIHEH